MIKQSVKSLPPRKMLAKYHWVQVWAGKWSLLICSDWGKYYTRTLRVANHPFLTKVAFLIRQGNTSAWFTKEDLDLFGGYLSTQAGADPLFIKSIASELKRQARRTLSFIDLNIGKTIDNRKYQEYLKIVRDYYVPHVQVKYIVDYLPPKLLEKYLPVLEAARLQAEPVFSRTIEFDSALAKNISQSAGYPPKFLLSLLQTELVDYFKTGKLPAQKILSARFQECALLFNARGQQLFVGQDVGDIAKVLQGENIGRTLRGNSAFPGKVRGKVRIIFDPRKDSVKFAAGEILVASMTRPEFLPLMEKAAAFITDGGGVLCHAAIVARELKKPCVVGTKNATQILKDGVLVEVDADQGVISLIKENSR